LVGTRLGSEFLPHVEEGNLWIRVQLPPSTGLDSGTPATRKLREVLMRHPEVITAVTQHGHPDNGQRRLAILQRGDFCAAQAVRQVAGGFG
jgi:heavy metal efflux system protein